MPSQALTPDGNTCPATRPLLVLTGARGVWICADSGENTATANVTPVRAPQIPLCLSCTLTTTPDNELALGVHVLGDADDHQLQRHGASVMDGACLVDGGRHRVAFLDRG